MSKKDFLVTASDGLKLSSYKFIPAKPKAAFLILHGSIEHATRYFNFASFLEKAGIAVYTFDQRGHGATAKDDADVAYFSDRDDGWHQSIADIMQIIALIREEQPKLTLTVFGHSMGSFLLRTLIAEHPNAADKAVICGTGDAAPFLIGFGKFLSNAFVKLKGRKTRSNLVHTLVYGTLNNRIKNPRTPFDFITHDEKVVDAYIADPRCGNLVTVEYAREMLSGIQLIGKKQSFENVNKDMPMLIVSGEDDPLAGKNRVDFNKVVAGYEKAGIKNLTLKVYPGMRHEVLNEIGKEIVYQDICDFILA